jgi:septal ring factor EnvC (AmiA/AmiB activator)
VCVKAPPRFPLWLAVCALSLLPSSPALSAQDFSAISDDLGHLEQLITNTLSDIETQQTQLEDLKRNLDESGKLLADYERIPSAQERLLSDLRKQLAEMSEVYRKQSSLLARYEKNSKVWRTFTLIAVPTAALLSGGVVYAVTR